MPNHAYTPLAGNLVTIMYKTLAAAGIALVSCVHYEDPNVAPGCGSDEQKISVTGLAGDFCSPKCDPTSGACPSDVGPNVTAVPTCVLKSPTGAKYCGLICHPDVKGSCGPNVRCSLFKVSLTPALPL